MAPVIPTREPSEFTAGDTVKWTISLGAFPADDGWALKYSFRGPEVHDVTATASGATHALEITAATSLDYSPGLYRWEAYASKALERYRVRAGQLTIKINLETVDEDFDARSYVEQVLDELRSLIKRKAGRDQASHSIGDRSISRMSWEEIHRQERIYTQLLKQEQKAERVKQGLGTGNIVRTRFGRTQ